MEVLNFFVERKSKLSSLCNCPLGQMSNIFVTGPRLRWSFFLVGSQTIYKLFWGFLSTFSKFFEQGKFKSSSWSCGKQILGGCTSLVSLKLSWTVSRFWCVLQTPQSTYFWIFSIFLSSHMRRTRWENWPDECKLVRCDSSLIKEVSSETGVTTAFRP